MVITANQMGEQGPPKKKDKGIHAKKTSTA